MVEGYEIACCNSANLEMKASAEKGGYAPNVIGLGQPYTHCLSLGR